MIEDATLMEMTTAIVSAYVSRNVVSEDDLPRIIRSVYEGLDTATKPVVVQGVLTPAVPIKKSVTDTYIVCLEDGKKFKTMKRHLMTVYGMTPDDYRTKWGLPKEYPMTAPAYSRKRADVAKELGLGTQRL